MALIPVVFIAAGIVAGVLVGATFLILTKFGDEEIAAQAGFQAIRWFMVAAIFASIYDVLEEGGATEMWIPGAATIVVLTLFEYGLRVHEPESV